MNLCLWISVGDGTFTATLTVFKGIRRQNLDVVHLALNVNIRKYLLKMHKLPFVQDQLSLNDTMQVLSERPIIGHASEQEVSASQEGDTPEQVLINPYIFIPFTLF